MPQLRRLVVPFTVFALFAAGFVTFARADDSSEAAVGEAEAQRLYRRANDFVTRIPEGDFSYAYIQFHWKRAQANIDRILRVYPNTTAGRALKANQYKLGPYSLDYFKNRVLPALEDKRLAAFDAVNCSIFLYNLDERRWDEQRLRAMELIVEVLARQKRWSEAQKFPVLDRDRLRKDSAIFRVAARYEQDSIVKDMLKRATPAERPTFDALLGEAIAMRGHPRTEISKLLDSDPSDAVKRAVLSGMIQREVQIQRAAALRLPKEKIILADDALKHPEVRDDVGAVARTFFPHGDTAANELLAQYRAALGETPSDGASIAVHLAYLEYLSAFDRFDDLEAYVAAHRLSDAGERAADFKVIELLARAGRLADAERHRVALSKAGGETAELASLAEFRGHMRSSEARLVVREKTLSDLPIKDPCVMSQAIMEWSLTPNRSIRGAAPYDSVVRKFAPGFENLPEPKSKSVRDAANTLRPY